MTTTTAPVDQEHIEFGDLIGDVLRRWWLVGLTATAFVGLCVVWLLVSTPVYTVRLLIAPPLPLIQESDGFDLSSLGGGGGVVSAARFIDLGNQPQRFLYFRALLVSDRMAQQLMAADGVAQGLFEDEWDPETGSWRPKEGRLPALLRSLRAAFGVEPWIAPSVPRMRDYLEDNLTISEQVELGGLTIAFEHEDREFARNLVMRIHATADQVLREDAARKIDATIAFTRESIDGTTFSVQREALIALLQALVKEQLTLRSNLPYAAASVDDVNVDDIPSNRKVALYLFLAGVLGLGFGSLMALVAAMSKRR